MRDSEQRALDLAIAKENSKEAVTAIQKVLDPLCVVGVGINPESRVQAEAGKASHELVEQGWRAFLIRVRNDAGVTAKLQVSSPNAKSIDDDWRQDPRPGLRTLRYDATHLGRGCLSEIVAFDT